MTPMTSLEFIGFNVLATRLEWPNLLERATTKPTAELSASPLMKLLVFLLYAMNSCSVDYNTGLLLCCKVVVRYSLTVVVGLCRRRQWPEPFYEPYLARDGYSCVARVNNREYHTDTAFETERLAQDNAAMRAYLICRNFSVNDGMYPSGHTRGSATQGRPVPIGTERRSTYIDDRSSNSSGSRSGGSSPSSYGSRSSRDSRDLAGRGRNPKYGRRGY